MMVIDVANAIADDLIAALQHSDRVLLAVAGGTTPAPIFDDLCAADLDWARVDVVATDERWVPEAHPRSNARMIKERLLVNRAAAATLIPLYRDSEAPENIMGDLENALTLRLPIDVALLGMGADMHTASLFPASEGLEEALDPKAPILVPVRSASQPEPRITLSARVLNDSLAKHIVITGPEKRAALTAAGNLSAHQAPIRAVWDGAIVHWAE
jgi:6-phosphogluconolactonase